METMSAVNGSQTLELAHDLTAKLQATYTGPHFHLFLDVPEERGFTPTE